MSKDTTMNEAQKIAQELAIIPDEFRDKAVAAMLKSQLWEIIDCPVTLDLALAFARLVGVDNTSRLQMRQSFGAKNTRSQSVRLSPGDIRS